MNDKEKLKELHLKLVSTITDEQKEKMSNGQLIELTQEQKDILNERKKYIPTKEYKDLKIYEDENFESEKLFEVEIKDN